MCSVGQHVIKYLHFFSSSVLNVNITVGHRDLQSLLLFSLKENKLKSENYYLLHKCCKQEDVSFRTFQGHSSPALISISNNVIYITTGSAADVFSSILKTEY